MATRRTRKLPGRRMRKGRKLNRRERLQVKRIVNVGRELKFHQTGTSSGSTSSTFGIAPLSDISQGTTDTTRIGDRITLKSMQLRITFVGSETTAVLPADNYNQFRFIVFQWKDRVSGNPAVADLLLNGPSGAVDIWSMLNHDNRQNYNILLDKTITCVNNSSTAAVVPVTGYQANHVQHRVWNFNFKKINKQLQYVAASATDGTNRLFYLMGGDSSATPHQSYFFMAKLFYYDA